MKNAVVTNYTPYGFSQFRCPEAAIAFNGQWRDPVGGGYPLGLGRRLYYGELMRFSSPDPLSPFGKGGLNAYSYCSCDPVNFLDPTGQMRWPWKIFSKVRGVNNAIYGADLKDGNLKHLIRAVIEKDPKLETGLFIQQKKAMRVAEVTLTLGKGPQGGAVIKSGKGRYHLKVESGDFPDPQQNPRFYSNDHGTFASNNKAVESDIYEKAGFIRRPTYDYKSGLQQG